MSARRVEVRLGDRSYPVIIGRGALENVRKLLPATARRAAIVTQHGLPSVGDLGVPTTTIEIPDGEHAKTLTTIESISREFARFGLTRNDIVVAVGGGLVTDVGGFAAASWHRGTAVLNVPTTVVGMIDAAIGGKTAVNLPEGKNLVGAFWQPIAVVCDPDLLAGLPDREWRCGLGEIAKYHFLAGDDLTSVDLEDRIARCAEIKADIVSQDEREGGRRALLNYGHTLAHAIETVGDHRLAHGEAVAVGLLFAARLAHRLGRIDDGRVEEHRRVVVDDYGLSPQLPSDLAAGDLVAAMERDKKAVDGLTFVLDGPRGIEVVAGIDPSLVREALVDFGAVA